MDRSITFNSKRLIRQTLVFLISLLLLVAFSTQSKAASDVIITEPSFSIVHSGWNTTLDHAERQIKEVRLDDQSAQALRTQITLVREAALKTSVDASDKSRELKKLSNSLGPVPKKGEPNEAPEVTYERRKLERQLREVEGQVKQSDLISKRSDILLHDISTIEINQIVSTLVRQDPLPLKPQIWMKAGSQFFTGYKELANARKEGGYKSPILIILPILTIIVFLAILAGSWARKGPLRHFQQDNSADTPSYIHRILTAFGVGIGRGVIPVLVFYILSSIVWIYWMKFELDPQFTWPRGVFYAVIFYLITTALIRAIFSPRCPQWNLTCVSAESAKKIAYRLNILMAALSFGIVIEAVLVDTGKALEFGSVYAFIKNSLVSVILLYLSSKKIWQISDVLKIEDLDQCEIDTARLWFWPYLRILTGLIAFAALICSILGFHNLADFLLPRIILTSFLAAVFVALRVLLRESLSILLEKETGIANSIRTALAFDKDTGKRLNFWIMTLIDLVAILAAAYLLLMLWKFPHQDPMQWLSSWFKGFSIGSYTFSLADVFLAFFVLFAIVTLTKVIRTLLENKLLPQTSMDIGVRTAVSSGIGYVGVLIAILMALSTLGIDLTKLALIAGALSVGIGFGLQNIVNNFVSGLVLLFERPIKIGDWVMVGELEGKVKQINVRSTEIETFSRASVIIPNSDLLQHAVINWTHKSAFGRVEISVGVSYESDIEQVEALLLECAEERSEVLSWPAPFVLFLDFGDSSLDFQLYVYVDNVERRLRIGSDLRKLIMLKFRQAGIEIPFPQRVVTLHQESVDKLINHPDSAPDKAN